MWREKSPISEKDSLRIRKWLLENQSGYLGIKKNFKKKLSEISYFSLLCLF